jgi:ribulose-phosphate 3-epimerase
MSSIVPAVLCETLEDYQATVARLEPFAVHAHVDITDGEFAPTFTVNVGQLYWPANWEVDLHAMVARPSEYLPALIALKPRTIIFHAEVAEDLIPVMQQVKAAGIKAGLALLRPTVPKNVAHLLGKYGGTASLMQLEKVRLIRSIQPSVEIGWDGGASMENVFSLSQGGIDVINTGGAINKADDAKAAYDALVAEANKHGVI